MIKSLRFFQNRGGVKKAFWFKFSEEKKFAFKTKLSFGSPNILQKLKEKQDKKIGDTGSLKEEIKVIEDKDMKEEIKTNDDDEGVKIDQKQEIVIDDIKAEIEEQKQYQKFSSVLFREKDLFKRYKYEGNIPNSKEELLSIFDVPEQGPARQIFDFAFKFLKLNQEKFQTQNNLNLLGYFFKKGFFPSIDEKSKKMVVTVMGHVDHGKTTLLDYLRQSSVAAKEAGGITQKIGGFTMNTHVGEISFIDTPGHQLFSNMRKTGVSVTDYVILIVSAIEGLQPQTKEVIELIKEKKLPYLVAVNKIDVVGSNVEQVEEELIDQGVELEPYGGNVPIVHISAKTGHNIDLLIELLEEESKSLKLTADFGNSLEAQIIESHGGKGNRKQSATLVIKNGILKTGQNIITEKDSFQITNIVNHHGEELQQAIPGDIVEVYGFNSLPESTETICSVENQNLAKIYKDLLERLTYLMSIKDSDFIQSQFSVNYKSYREKRKAYSSQEKMVEKMTEAAEKMFLEIKSGKLKEELQDKQNQQLLALNHAINQLKQGKNSHEVHLIKVPDYGTQVAIQEAINNLKNPGFSILSIDTTQLTPSDLQLCEQENITIVLFDVQMNDNLNQMLNDYKTQYLEFNIIYELLQYLESKSSKVSISPDRLNERTKGFAEVKKVFNLKQKGKNVQIAGCQVVLGMIGKDYSFKVLRNNSVLQQGLTLKNLQQHKNKIEQAKEGEEMGLEFEQPIDLEEGDLIECYIDQLNQKFIRINLLKRAPQQIRFK